MAATLLIVDDDANIVDGLKDILEEAGYRVRSAASGEQALARFEETVPAAVILDYHLPDMTGLALAERLRARSKDVALLLMTGMSTADLAGAPGRDAVDNILVKPVEPPSLLQFLHQAVTRLPPP